MSLVLICVAASADTQVPRFAFGVNGEDFSLSTYKVDEEGRLRHLGHRPIDKAPSRVVLDPSGKFILAVSNTTDNLMVFRLNPVTGDLTPVPGSPFATGGRSPFSIKFHPSGRFVYLGVRFRGVGAFTFNPDTGAVKPIPGSPFPAQRRTREVAIHPSGKYLYASNGYSNNVSAFTINQKTGVLKEMPGSPYSVGDFGDIDYPSLLMGDVPAGAGGLPISIDTDPEGHFVFVANKAGASVSVFAINPDDGRLEIVKGSPFFCGWNPYRLKVHPSGKFLYVTLWDSGQVSVHEINKLTGALSEINGSPFSTRSETPVDIAFNSEGSQVYVSSYDGNDISLFNVNVETGALTLKENVKTRLGPWSLQLVEGEKKVKSSETLIYSASMTAGIERLVSADEITKSVERSASDIQASQIAISPDGRFVYAINKDKSTLTTLSVNTESGELSPLDGGLVNTGKLPTDIVIDVNGWYLYVTNASDNSMSVYYLDSKTGVPKEVRGSPFRVGDKPVAVTLDSAARYSFVLNQKSENISVFRHINNVSPLIFEARKYGSPFAVGKNPVVMEVDPTGRYLYVVNAGSNSVSAFTVHGKSGALSAMKDSPYHVGQKPVALAINPDGRFLYVANEGSRDINLFHINALSGALVKKNNLIKLGFRPKSLWVDLSGGRLFVLSRDGKQLLSYSINKQNGSLSLLAKKNMHSAIDDLYLVIHRVSK